MCDPLGIPQAGRPRWPANAASRLFALEMLPRITRAQSMDVLSSQATIAGYRAVLLAAVALPKMFPMMITAAGTLNAAKVFVVGAGVAGLQAIATARRLGGHRSRPTTSARPSRSRCKAWGPSSSRCRWRPAAAEAKGGYAQQMDEEFYRKQRELMAAGGGRKRRGDHHRRHARQEVARAGHGRDGRPRWPPGSVIVDLAAERGRQLRADPARPDGRRRRRDDPRPARTCRPRSRSTPARCMPRTSTTFLLYLVKDGQVQYRPGRRDHPRNADCPRRRRWCNSRAVEAIAAEPARRRCAKSRLAVTYHVPLAPYTKGQSNDVA